MISDQLRQAIQHSGQTTFTVAKGAGIAPPILYRFVDSERTITLQTADKVCAFLGLRLTTQMLAKCRSKRGDR